MKKGRTIVCTSFFVKKAKNYLGILACVFLFTSLASGQKNQAEERTKTLVSQVGDIPAVKKGDTQIKLPAAPKGFFLQIAGSDNAQVIDSTGAIHTPLVSTTVTLYLKLKAYDTDEGIEVPNKSVIVPGKYANTGSNAKPFVIPALREWYGHTGKFELKATSSIVLNAKDKNVLQKAAGILQNDLQLFTGIRAVIKTGSAQPGDIYLTLQEEDKNLGEEGYYLTINDRITISALDYKGLFWGTRTILQLLEQDLERKYIPKGITRDYPKYEVRCFMLDVGRKFFTLEFLQDYVKMMSYYKMSNFQIHLNDNGFKQYFNNNWDSTYAAFRLENDTYPALTAKDGSYTKKEFIALQKLANDYAVTIIPEIDVPAHSLSFAHAIPELGSKKYGMDHLELHNPYSYQVVEDVLREYISGDNPVFLSKEVHIGTDEYDKRESEAFRAFTDHFIRYVQKFGKDVRVWGALTHAQGKTPVTSENVTMNAWYNGYAEPKEMKKLGYKLISTPDGYLYIVPAAGYYYDYLNREFLYSKWEPVNVGKEVFAPGDPAIRGGMFAVWNDIVGNGVTMKDVNDRVFPALQVLSQKMWAGVGGNLPYKSFNELSKKTGEGPGLNMRGILPAPNGDSLVAQYNFDVARPGSINVSLDGGIKGNAIHLRGGNSFVALPHKEIGFDYSVSFWIRPDKNDPGAVLFSSPNATVKIMENGCLGFSRENYNEDFGYTPPVNEWTHIVISGTNKGTALYVNGTLYKKLYDGKNHYAGMDKTTRRVQTLFFPLQMIGDKKNAFTGSIDELYIYNKLISEQKIKELARR